MAIDEVSGQAWTRKHDDPAMPVVPSAPRTVYPKSLEELIEICSKRKPSEKIHAAGSHWALSEAAISENVFVETHDPNNNHQAMGRTLYDVVPGCLNTGSSPRSRTGRSSVRHDPQSRRTRASILSTSRPASECISSTRSWTGATTTPGAWPFSSTSRWTTPAISVHGAFQTLGGAGGQTVFGALTTGTHGGDFLYPADRGLGDGAPSRRRRRQALLDRAGVPDAATGCP